MSKRGLRIADRKPLRRALFALAGLAALVVPNSGRAARVEADPTKLYVVAPEVGQWLICVATYSGPESRSQARELTLEVRRRDNLPAYIFDRGDEQRRQQAEERERLRQKYPEADLKRFKTTRIPEECVVLVGGYKDMDAARRDLEKVKKLKPPPEKLMQMLIQVDPVAAATNRGEIKGAYLNPFPSSFVARNPTVPAAVRENKPDPFLKQLNSDEPFSLLKCRQSWTLVVKTFEGAATVQSKTAPTGGFLDKLRNSFGGSDETLNASALQAREVAKVLQKNGFEAFILHTRHQSIVCVGGYARADDPRLQQVQRQVGNMTIGTIRLFASPIPMEVPKL